MAYSFEHMSDYIAARARNSNPKMTMVRNCLKEGRAALKAQHACEVEVQSFTVAGTPLTSEYETLIRGEPIMLRAYRSAGDTSDEMVVAGELIIRIKPSKLAKLR